MDIKDVKIGMKAVPHSKSVGWIFRVFSENKDYIDSKFFRENGYLFVSESVGNLFCLRHNVKQGCGFCFKASDFEPYVDPFTKKDIKIADIVTYRDGDKRTVGLSTCYGECYVLLNECGVRVNSLSCFADSLTHIATTCMDIVKVERPTPYGNNVVYDRYKQSPDDLETHVNEHLKFAEKLKREWKMKYVIGDSVLIKTNATSKIYLGIRKNIEGKVVKIIGIVGELYVVDIGNSTITEECIEKKIEVEFSKVDLLDRDIVTYKSGNTRVVLKGNLHTIDYSCMANKLSSYKDDLTSECDGDTIIKVERPIYETIWERKEPTPSKVNLVSAKHHESGKALLFQVPLGVEIAIGTKLYADTSKGKKLVTASCYSAERLESDLEGIIKVHGAYLPLKMIVGFAEETKTYKDIGFPKVEDKA